MPASPMSLERCDFSVWRRFTATVLAGPTPTAEGEIAEYLEQQKDDLLLMSRIEPERRRMDP
jgi:hypothetical protein